MGSNKKFIVTGVFIITTTATILNCSHSPQTQRTVASTEADAPRKRLHYVPTGLTGERAAQFNHLSQGSDIYPYEWMQVLQSADYTDKKDGNTAFLGDLDARFRVARDPDHGSFLLPWAGMSAVWSDHPPETSDVYTKDRDGKDTDYKSLVREVKSAETQTNVKSIKLAGVNCAFCHSGQINYQDQKTFIHGAPNLLNVRAYFRDLMKSTVLTMKNENKLKPFLDSLGVKDSKHKAKLLSKQFNLEFGRATGRDLGWLSDVFAADVTFLAAKLGDRSRLYEKGQKPINDALIRLLRVTYGFSDTDALGELPYKMNYLASLAVGTDPTLQEADVKFGRSDAFGRIGNLFVRGKEAVNLTGPASYPWLWGKQYQAFVHNMGNTNSVILRNIGESLSLGAVFFDPVKLTTSINVYNQDRLEQLMYDIEVPQWEKVFPNLKVNRELAETGKTLFNNKCLGCHSAKKEGVGPQGNLSEYKMFSFKEIGTDPEAAKNVGRQVGGVPFAVKMMEASNQIKLNYYKKYNVPPETQKEWEQQGVRGPDFFRDTYLGSPGIKTARGQFGAIEPGKMYIARPLAGVWATAPYLHNGSVPTLRALLKPSLRPTRFTVYDREYDVKNLGYSTVEVKAGRKGFVSGHEYFERCKKDPYCLDTTIPGNSNKGHDLMPEIAGLSDSDVDAVLEYLKILPPEPEYSWANQVSTQ